MKEWIREWIVTNLDGAKDEQILDIRKDGCVTARPAPLGWDLIVDHPRGYQRWLITREFLNELKKCLEEKEGIV